MVNALHGLSLFETLIGCGLVAVVVAILGFVTNAVLRDLGFGMWVNGVLVTLGLAGGIVARYMTLGFQ